MREGTASRTARGVAAHRLSYDRVAAPYGDPGGDDALTRDVADGLTPEHGRMHEYLRARTAYFDSVVVNSIGRGITQIVIGGAGYDGRALRYTKPGVRWFELDHPATQADKRARIARLGLDAGHVRFIPADFTVDSVTGPLRAAGLDPERTALFLFEGVAVYLERPVLSRVLAAFREATVAGSPLAISLSVGATTAERRASFQQRVAVLGEPARTMLTYQEGSDLLAAAGWKITERRERLRSLGLLVARAVVSREDDRPSPRTAPSPRPPASAPRDVTHQTGAPAGPPLSAPPGSLPLSALLSQALVAFTIEADNEAEHRLPHRTTRYGASADAPRAAPWLTSLLMWANCLRFLPDEGIMVAELRRRARTGTNLDGMRRWGYVTFTPDTGRPSHPKPDAIIAPTAWGIRAREIWQDVTQDVEARWRDRNGAESFSALRAALAGVVGQLDPVLPDCLPILGFGLFSRPADEAPGEAPATAADVSALPLWALLSRPLLAFAVQYEQEPGTSLAIGANVLRVLTAGGVHTKDIPSLAGVSAESVAIALAVLDKSGLATEGPDPAGRFRLTRLTDRGVAARDEYPARAAGIEADWRTRLGDGRAAALRAELESLAVGLSSGLTPYPGSWRAQVRPLTTLPHYPMTLHRGGYPDGS